ncbi:MAG: FmdB family zinc ribbon protein [Planctomycetota bacterium]|jgi:putative FmdB family regulatory protein
MPIYEYECKRCGERFEALLFGEQKAVCPQCAGRKLEKLVPSSFSVGGHRTPARCEAPPPGGG